MGRYYYSGSGYIYCGYEGYQVIWTLQYVFNTHKDVMTRYCDGLTYYGSYRETQLLPVPQEFITNGCLCLDIPDHSEILDSATKVYVHPNCTFSRTMLSSKYKRCLSPLLADAIVIPNDKTGDLRLVNEAAVFISDEHNRIVFCSLSEGQGWDEEAKETYDKITNASLGTNIKELLSAEVIKKQQNIDSRYLDCVLAYRGPVLAIPKDKIYIKDYIEGTLDANKIVLQDTIMKSLGDSTNTVTVEALISIIDMLKSNQEDTINLGLKTIAAMDYLSYPNSVKVTLDKLKYRWKGSKAKTNTAVKYMLKTLGINDIYNDYTNRFIDYKDAEVLDAVLHYMYPSPDKYESITMSLPFYYMDQACNILPRLYDR